MPSLVVSLNLVGALRELSQQKEPDPAQAAVLAELAGAGGISVMLRRDRKFLRDRDLYILKNMVKTKLNISMPPTDDIIERIIEVKPNAVTFVADSTGSDGPSTTIDFFTGAIDFSSITNRIKGAGVNINYFIEPETDAVKGALKSGADGIVLNCSAYSEAQTVSEARNELDKIDRAGQFANKQNVSVMAGRGLHYGNIKPLAELGNIREFIVGRAICTRALFHGFDRAVGEMIRIIDDSSRTMSR